MRLLAVSAAAVAAALLIVPQAAVSSQGPIHGPSATPLLVELLAVGLASLALVLRRPITELMRQLSHHAADAFRFAAHHRPHRVG